jgi:hypothetical protein
VYREQDQAEHVFRWPHGRKEPSPEMETRKGFGWAALVGRLGPRSAAWSNHTTRGPQTYGPLQHYLAKQGGR